MRDLKSRAAAAALVVAVGLGVLGGPAGAESDPVASGAGSGDVLAAAAPANDDFASAQVLTGPSDEVAGSNVGATLEPGEPTYDDRGYRSTVWYEWTAPADGYTTFSTQGSGVDTVLSVYEGETLDGLALVGVNDDKNVYESEVSVSTTAGTTYHLQVVGYRSATGPLRLMWWPEGGEPFYDDVAGALAFDEVQGKITLSTDGSTQEVGEPDHAGLGGTSSSWLAWTAPFDGSATFEAGENGTAIAIYTGTAVDALTLEGEGEDSAQVEAVAATTYLVAFDAVPTQQRITWALDVAAPNDDFADAQPISGASGSVAGTTFDATDEPGEPDHMILDEGRTIWYSFTPPTTGMYELALTGTASRVTDPYADVGIAAYTGTAIDALTEVAGQPPTGFNESVLRFRGQAGTTYSIVVDGYLAITELTWGPASATFSDVSTSHPFYADVEWMNDTSLSTGYSNGTFRPAAPLTRQALAAFVFRYEEADGFVPPAQPTFSDVGTSHPFYAEIEWMYAEDLTDGYPDGTFRPSAPLTRQAMAAFFARLFDGLDFEPPAQPSFRDVSPSHPFYAEIEWMNTVGISTGYADGTFRPSATVTRQALSAFFRRADRSTW